MSRQPVHCLRAFDDEEILENKNFQKKKEARVVLLKSVEFNKVYIPVDKYVCRQFFFDDSDKWDTSLLQRNVGIDIPEYVFSRLIHVMTDCPRNNTVEEKIQSWLVEMKKFMDILLPTSISVNGVVLGKRLLQGLEKEASKQENTMRKKNKRQHADKGKRWRGIKFYSFLFDTNRQDVKIGLNHQVYGKERTVNLVFMVTQGASNFRVYERDGYTLRPKWTAWLDFHINPRPSIKDEINKPFKVIQRLVYDEWRSFEKESKAFQQYIITESTNPQIRRQNYTVFLWYEKKHVVAGANRRYYSL